MANSPIADTLDPVIRRAQHHDSQALEHLLQLVSGPVRRQLARLGVPANDRDDVLQAVLLDIARGIGSYRWQAGFLGWTYTIAARRAARARHNARPVERLNDLQRWLADGEDPFEEHEQLLTTQAAHLHCALAITLKLSPALRQAYLLGDVLALATSEAAAALHITPSAYRQRLVRARKTVHTEIRQALTNNHDTNAPTPAPPEAPALDELDRLVQLGELHRAAGQPANAAAGLRTLRTSAPTLLTTTANRNASLLLRN